MSEDLLGKWALNPGVHKARNITERLAKPLHAGVRKALRQAWELADAEKAEKLIGNLARRLECEAPGARHHPRP